VEEADEDEVEAVVEEEEALGGRPEKRPVPVAASAFLIAARRLYTDVSVIWMLCLSLSASWTSRPYMECFPSSSDRIRLSTCVVSLRVRPRLRRRTIGTSGAVVVESESSSEAWSWLGTARDAGRDEAPCAEDASRDGSACCSSSCL
jgi:hypothetical protein